MMPTSSRRVPSSLAGFFFLAAATLACRTQHRWPAGPSSAANQAQSPAAPAKAIASNAANTRLDGGSARLVEGLERVDELIDARETHFAALWRVTSGGENAEGYFSFAGDRLVLQRRFGDAACDRIFVTQPGSAAGQRLRQVSSGRGVTTCAYFLPGDQQVVFASTQAFMAECPPPADHSQGYTWTLHPEYELFTRDLAGGGEKRLTESWGYDAEATVSPRQDRMVFTSMRSGDPELYTCDMDGGNVQRVTDTTGYDGGAFFSHSGTRLVFRHTVFGADGTPSDRVTYGELLRKHQVRPHAMELAIIDVDGSDRAQLTNLGGANFAPYFFPDDQRVIFSTNHHESGARNFDLYAIAIDGSALERITYYDGFDSFPMFSPDGTLLVFASNRGGSQAGETNLYVAQWKP